MLKTSYKAAQVIAWYFAVVFFLSLAVTLTGILGAGHHTPKSIIGAIAYAAAAIYIAVLFPVRFCRVSFDEKQIIIKRLFASRSYTWASVAQVLLSTKENFSILYILGYDTEATVLTFEDGKRLVLWNDYYSNMAEIRSFIAAKAAGKITDPRPKLSTNIVNLVSGKEYKGNPYTTLSTLVTVGATIVVYVSTARQLNAAGMVLVPAAGLLLAWVMGGSQMNYFIIDNGQLMVKNHFFTWKNRVFDLADIQEADVETPQKRATSLRIMTSDYQSSLFQGGSLRDKHWRELVTDLRAMGIPVRVDAYIGRIDESKQ